MEQRNTPCTAQTTGSKMDHPGQGFQHPEPIYSGAATNFPSPTSEGMITVRGNAPNLSPHGQDHYDGFMSYVRPQLHDVSHQPYHDSTNYNTFCPPLNLNISYAAPQCSNVGAGVQLTPCSNYGVIGFPGDDHELRNLYKRSAYGAVELRSVRNRSGVYEMVPVGAHGQNHSLQGNYMGQSFPPVGFPWPNQHFSNVSGGVGTLPAAWTHAPPMIYMPWNSGPQWYPQPSTNQNNLSFLPPAPVLHASNYSHLPGPIQAMGNHHMSLPPQVPSHHFGFSNCYSATPFQDGLNGGHRRPRSVQPTGLGIPRHHLGGVGTDISPGHQNLPRLRFLPTDGVALVEFPQNYGAENYSDNYRDMRLDVDFMSYEELLVLGEHIGNVNTGVSDEIIKTKLKMRTYLSSTTIDLEDEACNDHESNLCGICLDDYRNEEVIATLDCGHDYHACCLKQWLHIKNVCPICKCEAVPIGEKDGQWR